MAITDQIGSRPTRDQRSYSADIEAIKNHGLANRYSNEQRRNTDAGDAGRRLPSVSKLVISKAKRPPFATQDSIEEEEDVTQANNIARKSDHQSQSIIISKEEKSKKSQRSLKIQKSDEASFVAEKNKEESIRISAKYHPTRSHSAGATCSRTRDSRSSTSSSSKPSRERRYTDTALDSPNWESPTSLSFTREDVFAPIESLLEKTKQQQQQQQQSSSLGSTPTGTVRRSFVEQRDSYQKKHPSFDQTCRRSSGINQRIRDLYDFKVETEWPRKTRHQPRKSSIWTNSGGSEEEEHRGLLQEISKARTSVSESRESSNKKISKEGHDRNWAIFNEQEHEERLRIFHDKLRYSEDLGQPINRREKRIYSDDYGSSHREFESEKIVKRTASSEGRPMTPRPRADLWDINRPSGASRESWISYAEIEQARRKSRVSDASYVSIDTSKRDSAAEILPRRSLSQGSEPTPSSTTPSTPPSSPLTKDSAEGKPRLKPERQGSKFKIYLV